MNAIRRGKKFCSRAFTMGRRRWNTPTRVGGQVWAGVSTDIFACGHVFGGLFGLQGEKGTRRATSTTRCMRIIITIITCLDVALVRELVAF
jgi:hypothetical protein